MVSRARQCCCVIQGAPGGKASFLPRETAGEAAGSTEMPTDLPHRPLGATKTLPHRPCPLCPRPGQLSASSHLPGLVVEPVDPTLGDNSKHLSQPQQPRAGQANPKKGAAQSWAPWWGPSQDRVDTAQPQSG